MGAGTVRSDDPKLDVRGIGLASANPVRVVVTGGLTVPRDGHLGETAHRTPLWLCHHAEAEPARRKAWEEKGAVLIDVPFQPDGQLDLSAMMQSLGARGLTRLLCEGGGRLAAALLAADLVDEIVTYTAGIVLGDDAVAAIGTLGDRCPPTRAAIPVARNRPDRPRRAQPLAPAIGLASAPVRRQDRGPSGSVAGGQSSRPMLQRKR